MQQKWVKVTAVILAALMAVSGTRRRPRSVD